MLFQGQCTGLGVGWSLIMFSSLEFFCFGLSQRGFRPFILLDPKMTSSTDFKVIQPAVHVETLDAILVSGFAFVKNFLLCHHCSIKCIRC